jgi:hypothetical protein
MPGFVGAAFGADGCRLATAGGGGNNGLAAPPEVSFTIRVETTPAVATGQPAGVQNFSRLVIGELADALGLDVRDLEVTLVESSEESDSGSTEGRLLFSRAYDDLPSPFNFEREVESALAALLGIQERVVVTGLASGSVAATFYIRSSQSDEPSVTESLSLLAQHVADGTAGLAAPGTVLTDLLGYPEPAQLAPLVEVTIKMRSGALDGDSRTIETVLLELNDLLASGSLGSLRLPGQNVFDTLVLSCPAGTYQNPTAGCIPCDPGYAPTSSADGCVGCAIFAVIPNTSAFASPDGRGCGLCPAGMEPDVQRADCVPCLPGRAADGLGQICQACADRTMIPAPDNDYCTCAPFTLDLTVAMSREHTAAAFPGARCPFCVPGYMPNAARAQCSACEEGTVKEQAHGDCQPCGDSTVANTDGTRCLPCDGMTTANSAGDACVTSGLAVAGIILAGAVIGGLGGVATVTLRARRKQKQLVYAIEAGFVEPDALPTSKQAERLGALERLRRAATKAAEEQFKKESRLVAVVQAAATAAAVAEAPQAELSPKVRYRASRACLDWKYPGMFVKFIILYSNFKIRAAHTGEEGRGQGREQAGEGGEKGARKAAGRAARGR